MSRINIAPTKSNQIRLKRDLAMASEGFSLLEQKREILVMELMRLLDRVKEVQFELEERSQKASSTLRMALSRNGYQRMNYQTPNTPIYQNTAQQNYSPYQPMQQDSMLARYVDSKEEAFAFSTMPGVPAFFKNRMNKIRRNFKHWN